MPEMPPGWPPLTEIAAAARALALALAAVLSLPAAAQVLFKLIDRQGRVTYSDSEPKDFDGTVIRLEPDTAANIVPSTEAERPPRADAGSGLAETRRRTREELDKKLRAAQASVEAARKAKDEGGEPLAEELQTVQHRQPPLRSGEPPPNPNCFAARDASGAPVLHCPTRVPQESYYERQKKLAEELARAEEELALAERAYRRGTD